MQKINPSEAKKIMDDGMAHYLLDVRDMEEYKKGHIKGALLIPLPELEKRAALELSDKEKMILVYCHSGMRAGKAALLLDSLGYKDVKSIGGVVDWTYGLEV